MKDRDITIVIVLILYTTPACFSTFMTYYGPYSSWKFTILLYTSLLTSFYSNIVTGEPTHFASKECSGAATPVISLFDKYPLCFVMFIPLQAVRIKNCLKKPVIKLENMDKSL